MPWGQLGTVDGCSISFTRFVAGTAEAEAEAGHVLLAANTHRLYTGLTCSSQSTQKLTSGNDTADNTMMLCIQAS